MAKQGILSRLLGGGKADKATAPAKGAPGKAAAAGDASDKGAQSKDAVPAAAPSEVVASADTRAKKPAPPYAMTEERQALIDEALRVRAQVREDLSEERVKKLETIIKHKGGV